MTRCMIMKVALMTLISVSLVSLWATNTYFMSSTTTVSSANRTQERAGRGGDHDYCQDMMDASPVTTTSTVSLHTRRGINNSQRLEYVHIPKTGGTAIEYAAAMANITWSMCHFPTKEWCVHKKEKRRRIVPGIPVSIQHVPPYLFTSQQQQQQEQHNDNNVYYFANSTMFTVVRNPYERIISEYYYRKHMHRQLTDMNNVTVFNDWLHEMLVSFQNENNTRSGYFQFDGHFIPQYHYVFDPTTQHQIIHHVLTFESLPQDFMSLMKQYGLEKIVLSSGWTAAAAGGGKHSSNKQLGVSNMTIDNICLLDSVYANDFVAFGYRPLCQVFEATQCPPSIQLRQCCKGEILG